MPGAGDTPPFANVDQLADRTLPHHAECPTMSVSDATKDGLEGYRRLLEAARSGAPPDLDGLDPLARGSAERAWKSIRELAVENPPRMRLTRSDSGDTVLANNAVVGNDDGFVTYINLRQQGDRLYQLKPGKLAHCISELHLLK
jgi:hypothetical protein